MTIKCTSAIVASKLFKSSPRQKAILAALNDPVNVELVTQLDEYIGDEYRDLLNPPEADTEPAATNPVDAPDADAADDAGNGPAPGMNPKVAKFSPNPGLAEKHSGDLAALDAENADKLPDESAEEPEVDSATTVSGKTIMADTSTLSPDLTVHASLPQLAGELKGTLNARTNTAGITRVSVKNDEVWLYYSDDVNLNNVLPAVLDLLTYTNYSYLIFNRLARTENAMVFTLSTNDTLSQDYGKKEA